MTALSRIYLKVRSWIFESLAFRGWGDADRQRQETGSTYESSNEQVITISAEGSLQVVGNGTATVIAKSAQQGTLEIIVKVAKTIGRRSRPWGQTVKGKSTVALNGLEGRPPTVTS